MRPQDHPMFNEGYEAGFADAINDVVPDLVEAAQWALNALAPFSKEPAPQSGIVKLRAAIAASKRRIA